MDYNVAVEDGNENLVVETTDLGKWMGREERLGQGSGEAVLC